MFFWPLNLCDIYCFYEKSSMNNIKNLLEASILGTVPSRVKAYRPWPSKRVNRPIPFKWKLDFIQLHIFEQLLKNAADFFILLGGENRMLHNIFKVDLFFILEVILYFLSHLFFLGLVSNGKVDPHHSSRNFKIFAHQRSQLKSQE